MLITIVLHRCQFTAIVVCHFRCGRTSVYILQLQGIPAAEWEALGKQYFHSQRVAAVVRLAPLHCLLGASEARGRAWNPSLHFSIQGIDKCTEGKELIPLECNN